MNWIIISAVIVFFVLLIIYKISFHKSKKLLRNTYISNTKTNDEYVELWNKELFVPVCNIKINYMVVYHYITKFPYFENTVNIILDGEPMDLRNVKADLVISTKKTLLPSNTPYIYLPYFVWTFVQKKIDPIFLIKNENENIVKSKFCCFMYSNCDDKMDGVRNRKQFLKLMNRMSGNRVDNLGRCYNNNYINNGNWIDNNDIYKPYKFVIAFENQQIKGYITEKLVMPMLARAIPIYLGAEDVSEYFNKNSFINVRDFPTFEKCIEYVLKVDQNDDLYQSIMNEPYLIENKIDQNLFSMYYGGKFYSDVQKALTPYNLNKFIRPCKIYRNNIRFITFADEKVYKNDRILTEAENSGFFKECLAFSPKDFDMDFINKHYKFIQAYKRGYGYWIWKPYFILRNLNNLEYGDYLVYCDSGNTVNAYGYKRIKEYYEMLERYEMIVFRMQYDEKDYTKMDTILNIFQIVGELKLDKQITAGVFLFKKTDNTVKLIQLWYDLMCDYHNTDDSPSLQNNFPSFIEHRHDQSIIPLLIKTFEKCLILNDNYSDDKNGFEMQNGEQNPIVLTRKK